MPTEVTVEEQRPSWEISFPSLTFALRALTLVLWQTLSDVLGRLHDAAWAALRATPGAQLGYQLGHLALVKLPHLLEPQLLLLRMEVIFLACQGWCEARVSQWRCE